MRKTSAIILLLFVCGVHSSFAQAEHPKKTYVDSLNRIFIQSSLPIYLFASTSPDGKDPMKMGSESFPKNTNPMHLDGQGKHFIRHKDVHENTDILFEMYADNTPPVTQQKFSFHGVLENNLLFFGKNVSLSLSAKDELSGLESIFYSIDGQDFVKYSGSVSFDQEKIYEFSYYSLDHVGNVEQLKKLKFQVDLNAPTTKIELKGNVNENVLSGKSSLQLSATDALSGVKAISYKIDDGQIRKYTAPILTSWFPEGKHHISYFATDVVDNVEAVDTLDFIVDYTAPGIQEEIVGKKFSVNGKEYYSGKSKMQLNTSDNFAGVKEVYYSMNGSTFKIYTEPFELESVNGRSQVKYYAIDFVGNKNTLSVEKQSEKAITTNLDFTGPSLSHSFNGPVFYTADTIFITSKTRIGLAALDKESGLFKITYQLDDKETKDFKESFPILKEGLTKVTYEGFDNLINSSRNDFFVTIDSTGPEIFHQFSLPAIQVKETALGKQDVYPQYAVLFLSAMDMISGYEKMYFTINNSLEKQYATVIKNLKPGDYSVNVVASDKLGNQKTKTIKFSIAN